MLVRDILKSLKKLKKNIQYTHSFLEKWENQFGQDRFPLVHKAIKAQEAYFQKMVEKYKLLKIEEDREIFQELGLPLESRHHPKKGEAAEQRKKGREEEEILDDEEEDDEDFEDIDLEEDLEEDSDDEEEDSDVDDDEDEDSDIDGGEEEDSDIDDDEEDKEEKGKFRGAKKAAKGKTESAKKGRFGLFRKKK